jgi:hypothetical protein
VHRWLCEIALIMCKLHLRKNPGPDEPETQMHDREDPVLGSIRRLLRSDEPALRVHGIAKAIRLPVSAVEEELLAALDDDSAHVRSMAGSVIAQSGKNLTPRIEATLREKVQTEPNDHTRARLLNALVVAGVPIDVDYWIDLLPTAGFETACSICYLLGQVGSLRAISAPVHALHHPISRVALGACVSLITQRSHLAAVRARLDAFSADAEFIATEARIEEALASVAARNRGRTPFKDEDMMTLKNLFARLHQAELGG